MKQFFIEKIKDIIVNNFNTILLVGDLGYKMFDKIIEMCPSRFINCGVAQQNMISIASGLAIRGWKVYVYSISNFPTMRCLQQIRNDVIYHNLDVNIISTAGISYGYLGFSHYAIEDIALINALTNMTIYSPSDIKQLNYCMSDSVIRDTPSYIRLTFCDNRSFQTQIQYGKFRNIISNIENDTLLLVSGGILFQSLNKFKDTDIYSVPFLSDLDLDFICNRLNKYKTIYTLQQHRIVGGLGSMISEIIAEQGLKLKITRLGIHHIPKFVGSREYLLEKLIWDNLCQRT